jgi:hypothetical protein
MTKAPHDIVTILLLSIVAVGCRRPSAVGDATPAQRQPAQTRPQGPIRILSFAAFQHDELIECDDLEIPQQKAGTDLKSASDQIWNAFNKPKGTQVITRLPHSCADQFSDRPPFGTCKDVGVVKDAPGLRGRIGHYSFADVFRSDWAMRECLESGGRWSSMRRDSPEFREAQLRFDALQMQHRMDKLAKHIDD